MITNRLIVFTRYPRPGQAKTRLITALGPVGAAELHRRLTEHAVAQARRLGTGGKVAVEIHFTGGDSEAMATWLGPDLSYRRQHGENLGARLDAAFAAAFGDSAAAVVIMGTDCPDLTDTVLGQAFAALAENDLVLGPAGDGGYYLIGLKSRQPCLFTQIDWGTDRVLSRTKSKAKALGLKIAGLEQLDDIDRPEDLQRAAPFLPPWKAAAAGGTVRWKNANRS